MTMIGSQPGEIVAVVQCLLLSHGGFTALSGAMDRHRDLLPPLTRAASNTASNTALNTAASGSPGTARSERRYRLIGTLLLALSLLPCLRAWPPAIGCVAWCMMLGASAALLVIVLQYAPRFVRWGLWLAPLAALGLLALDQL